MIFSPKYLNIHIKIVRFFILTKPEVTAIEIHKKLSLHVIFRASV